VLSQEGKVRALGSSPNQLRQLNYVIEGVHTAELRAVSKLGRDNMTPQSNRTDYDASRLHPYIRLTFEKFEHLVSILLDVIVDSRFIFEGIDADTIVTLDIFA